MSRVYIKLFHRAERRGAFERNDQKITGKIKGIIERSITDCRNRAVAEFFRRVHLTEHPALLFNGCCADYCGDDVFHPRCRDVNDADGRADRNEYDQEPEIVAGSFDFVFAGIYYHDI